MQHAKKIFRRVCVGGRVWLGAGRSGGYRGEGRGVRCNEIMNEMAVSCGACGRAGDTPGELC